MHLTGSCRNTQHIDFISPRRMNTRPAFTGLMERWTDIGHGCPPVLRLGLATRGDTHLTAGDVVYAVKNGVNYLNWCGYDDGLAQALRKGLLPRSEVVIAMQLEARQGRRAKGELEKAFELLATDTIDVVTFYYVESDSEWKEIIGAGGALAMLAEARGQGRVRIIGLTTHQRELAANWVQSGKLDLLMIRYNAAHRGAEQDVFPVTKHLQVRVVGFTAQRWGALCRGTPDDPPGFRPFAAREWYRFALAQPSLAVVLMAPANRNELEEDLSLLQDWRCPAGDEFEQLAAHGQRVRRHAGRFP